MSHLILPTVVAAFGSVLWVICHTTEIVHEPHWPAVALTVAFFSAYLLRSSWRRQLSEVAQESYANGYLRRVEDELRDANSMP